MSISLRKEQGVHFMGAVSSKTPISAQKGFKMVISG